VGFEEDSGEEEGREKDKEEEEDEDGGIEEEGVERTEGDKEHISFDVKDGVFIQERGDCWCEDVEISNDDVSIHNTHTHKKKKKNIIKIYIHI
jgi:hypothetical protein